MQEELGPKGFTVVAVALDSEAGAPEPWITQAAPTYPALIDRTHRVAELYNLVNVPQAVWIDEEGRIVRPPEAAGSHLSFSKVDPVSRQMPSEEIEKRRLVRSTYLNAIRDWVTNGKLSRYILDEREAKQRISLPDDDIVLAHASFRLGTYLLSVGREAEALAFLDEASRLHPDSWAIFRQRAEKNPNGIAGGQDFRERVAALGDKDYYAKIDMPGMPP